MVVEEAGGVGGQVVDVIDLLHGDDDAVIFLDDLIIPGQVPELAVLGIGDGREHAAPDHQPVGEERAARSGRIAGGVLVVVEGHTVGGADRVEVEQVVAGGLVDQRKQAAAELGQEGGLDVLVFHHVGRERALNDVFLLVVVAGDDLQAGGDALDRLMVAGRVVVQHAVGIVILVVVVVEGAVGDVGGGDGQVVLRIGVVEPGARALRAGGDGHGLAFSVDGGGEVAHRARLQGDGSAIFQREGEHVVVVQDDGLAVLEVAGDIAQRLGQFTAVRSLDAGEGEHGQHVIAGEVVADSAHHGGLLKGLVGAVRLEEGPDGAVKCDDDAFGRAVLVQHHGNDVVVEGVRAGGEGLRDGANLADGAGEPHAGREGEGVPGIGLYIADIFFFDMVCIYHSLVVSFIHPIGKGPTWLQ